MEYRSSLIDISVFLDTNQLHSPTDYVAIPRGETQVANVAYYVSTLSVEERAASLYKEFNGGLPYLKQFPRLIERTNVRPDVDYFRGEITAQLQAYGNVTIYDPIPHGIIEQTMLFKAQHEGEYRDAMIFASALAFAKTHSLPKCIFVTDDQKPIDFPQLKKTLSSLYSMDLMTKVQFKAMLDLGVALYDALLSRLKPQLEELAQRHRPALAARIRADPFEVVLSSEDTELIERVVANTDAGSIECEVRELTVYGVHPSATGAPTEVSCVVFVRYSVGDTWSRFYRATASAALRYSPKGELAEVDVTNFLVDTEPCG